LVPLQTKEKLLAEQEAALKLREKRLTEREGTQSQMVQTHSGSYMLNGTFLILGAALGYFVHHQKK